MVTTSEKLQRPLSGAVVWPWAIILLSLVCLWGGILYLWLEPFQQQVMIDTLGVSPAQLAKDMSNGQWFGLAGIATVTSLFVHSSWLHMLGNLAYLWVFGWPIERRVGPWLFALIFLMGGLLAHVVLALQVPELENKVIGASGAVSAVVGAYLGLFPSRRLGLYLPLGLVVEFVRVPAVLVIGSWFALQLVYATPGPISGVMAWWTHLAGFTFGLMFALLVRALGAVRPDLRQRD